MLGFIDTFKLYIIGALLAALAVGTLYHTMRVSSLEGRITTLESDNGKLRVVNATLTAANEQAAKDIDTQNKAVAALRTEAERQSKAAAAAMQEVAKERDKWKWRYAQLFSAPQPSGEDECQAIAGLLNQYHITRIEEAKR